MIEIHGDAKVPSTLKIKGSGVLKIGAYTSIEDYVLLDLGDNGIIEIAERCNLKQGAVLRTYDGHIHIGQRVSVGEYTILAGHGGLTIGDTSILAGHCYVSAANHIFHSDDPIRFQGEICKGITIDKDVWIGARCTILDSINVGKGCVVGAGSLVTNDLKENHVCFGVPCKEIYKKI